MSSLKKAFHEITLGSWIRIFIVVLLVIGAYAWGVIEGSKFGPKYPKIEGKYGRQMMGDYQRQYQSKNMNPMNKDHDSMNMAEMAKMLEGKTGDALDSAFLEMMIPHHQGAIDMAKYLTGAKHDELKKLGANIIASQANEIAQMEAWQKAWGYTSTGSTSTGGLSPQEEMMREHCKQMPEMMGCEKYR